MLNPQQPTHQTGRHIGTWDFVRQLSRLVNWNVFPADFINFKARRKTYKIHCTFIASNNITSEFLHFLGSIDRKAFNLPQPSNLTCLHLDQINLRWSWQNKETAYNFLCRARYTAENRKKTRISKLKITMLYLCRFGCAISLVFPRARTRSLFTTTWQL